MFSLTRSGPYYSTVGFNPDLQFRDAADNLHGRVTADAGRLRADTPAIPIPVPREHVITREHPLGNLVLLELPAGDYEFFRFRAWADPGAGMPGVRVATTVESSTSFVHRFQAVAGRVTYIGNLNFAFNSSGVTFQVDDRRERDFGLFDQQFPALKDTPRIEQVRTRG